jgi:hypothetical protein
VTFSSVAYVIIYIVSIYTDILSLVSISRNFSLSDLPLFYLILQIHEGEKGRKEKKEGKNEGTKEERNSIILKAVRLTILSNLHNLHNLHNSHKNKDCDEREPHKRNISVSEITFKIFCRNVSVTYNKEIFQNYGKSLPLWVNVKLLSQRI